MLITLPDVDRVYPIGKTCFLAEDGYLGTVWCSPIEKL
jgi:hypothetical protein